MGRGQSGGGRGGGGKGGGMSPADKQREQLISAQIQRFSTPIERGGSTDPAFVRYQRQQELAGALINARNTLPRATYERLLESARNAGWRAPVYFNS